MRKADSMAAWRAQSGVRTLADLYELMTCCIDVPGQLQLVDQAITAISAWVDLHRQLIGTEGDSGPLVAKAVKAYPDAIKAEPMTTAQLDSWLQGRVARRILVVPFTGPLPGGKAGLDLDGEYFDDTTDLYGPYPTLRATPDRLVDWHHDGDPTGVMKGAILGRITMDQAPEADGLWADFWVNAGERRRTLLAALEARGVPLYGSSQAVPGAVRKAADGHLEVWPIVRHTITTSPQNTHAVVPPLKALLATGSPSEATSRGAILAALLGPSDTSDLLGTSAGSAALPGDPAATTADARLEAILAEGRTLLGRLAQRHAAQETAP